MGTLLGRWVPRENSFFRETLGESGRVGPRIGVFWASGSASLPETGAKRRGEYPHGPSIIPMGSHPCSLAPFLGYTTPLCQNTPPPPTLGLPKKRVFYPPTLQGTHMVPLHHPWGGTPVLGPCLWQRSAAGCPKTPFLGPAGALSPKVSLKNEFSPGTHQVG